MQPMPAVILPLDKLASFNDGFEEFCRDSRGITTLAGQECNRLPERQGISVQPAASSAWILLRNASNTFLLVEYHREAAQWKTFLVPDPKKAVDELKSILGNWTDILPILKIAHEKAHPLEKKPDLKYVENLLTEAYHHLHPNEFLSQRINRGQG
jgi:hypothetical protein